MHTGVAKSFEEKIMTCYILVNVGMVTIVIIIDRSSEIGGCFPSHVRTSCSELPSDATQETPKVRKPYGMVSLLPILGLVDGS